MDRFKLASPALAVAGVLTMSLQPALAGSRESASAPTSQFSQTIFYNAFDKQKIGPVQTGSTKNQFTLLAGTNNMTVGNTNVASKPNALRVTVGSGGSAFVNKFFTGSYLKFQGSFAIKVGADFSIAPGGYVGLASTEAKNYAKTRVGRVELTLNPGGQLGLTYYDTSYASTKQQKYVWAPSGQILPRHVYWIVEQETFGLGGSIVVYLNGAQVINVQNINLGTMGTHLFDVGNLYAAPDYSEGGHLYFDNIRAATVK